MSRALKTLVVSESVLPKRCGSSIVIENFAKEFSRDEMVVLGDCPIGTSPLYQRNPVFPEVHYFATAISMAGRGARFFSKIRWRLFNRLVRQIEATAKQHDCNHILGVYPDAMWCFAACQAAMKLGVRFDSYFHNTYVDNSAIRDANAERVQSQIFESSRIVFVMSEGMKRYMDPAYPQTRFEPLVHTFQDFPTPRSSSPIGRNRPTKVLLFGNFNQSNLDATLRLQSAVALRDDYELHFYTDVPRPLLRQRGVIVPADCYHGSLGNFEFPQMINEIRRYDMIALTHGLVGGYGDVEYRTIFPTRTIPMMLSGVPMLVHSPAEAFLTEFVATNGIAELVTTPDEPALLAALDRLKHDSKHGQALADCAVTASRQFHGKQVARRFRELVRTSARS